VYGPVPKPSEDLRNNNSSSHCISARPESRLLLTDLRAWFRAHRMQPSFFILPFPEGIMAFQKSWRSNLATLLITSLIVLSLLEAACRIFGGEAQSVHYSSPAPGPKKSIVAQTTPDAVLYTLRGTERRLTPNVSCIIKNHRLSHQDVEIETNSLGFRDAEIGPKESDEIRILVLGDSITFGDYVSLENTYPERLEELLRKDFPDKKIRVINAGVGGIDLKTAYHILLEKGLSIQPDYVLIGLYLNDASPSWGIVPLPKPWRYSAFLSWVQKRLFVLSENIHLKQALPERAESLKKFSQENLMAGGNWREDPKAFNYEISLAFGDWGYAWSGQAWQEMKGFLAEMKTLEKKYHFQLLVGLLPLRYQVETRFSNDIPQKYFDSLMNELEIPHADTLPLFRNSYQRSPEDLFYDHCHLTPYGNALAAWVLASELKKILAAQGT